MTDAAPDLDLPESAIARPFWDAVRARELVLQWCIPCSTPIHYPREACPRCLGASLEWRPASGRGAIHSFTVVHRTPNPAMKPRLPYVVALVDLDEGARFLSQIVGCEPASVAVGQRVEVAFETLGGERVLPVFRRVE